MHRLFIIFLVRLLVWGDDAVCISGAGSVIIKMALMTKHSMWGTLVFLMYRGGRGHINN